MFLVSDHTLPYQGIPILISTAVMGFFYGIMKAFVAAKTIKKFHPMSNGGALALEFNESKVARLGEKLPKEYGGKGDELSAVGKEPLLE